MIEESGYQNQAGMAQSAVDAYCYYYYYYISGSPSATIAPWALSVLYSAAGVAKSLTSLLL